MNSKNNKKLENLSLPNGFWSPLNNHQNLYFIEEELHKEHMKLANHFLKNLIPYFKNNEISKELFIDIAQLTIERLVKEINWPKIENEATLLNQIPLN